MATHKYIIFNISNKRQKSVDVKAKQKCELSFALVKPFKTLNEIVAIRIQPMAIIQYLFGSKVIVVTKQKMPKRQGIFMRHQLQ